MLNQLLSEMGALRWELRCPQNLQPAKPQCYELHRNGALLAYISVAAADKAQENLLLKMLAAIDFEHILVDKGYILFLDPDEHTVAVQVDHLKNLIKHACIYILFAC